MKLNEKGLTLIELLISMLILIVVITATLQFYDTYRYEKKQYGEYITAKNLAVKALEEQRNYLLTTNDFTQQGASEKVVRLEGINFKITVEKQDESDHMAILTDGISFVKLTSKVEWKLRKLEVNTYVSSRE